MLAYRELPNADLFSEEWVAVPIHPREMPGYKSARITCELCGEGINYDREVHRDGKNPLRGLRLPRDPLLPAPHNPRSKLSHHKQQGRRGNLSATGPLNLVKALRQRTTGDPNRDGRHGRADRDHGRGTL